MYKLIFEKYYIDLGLLILRIGIGIMFIYHGYSKVFGGPAKWIKVGKAMSNLGIDFIPAFWGFMAGFSEFFGGICLILGLFVRPMCAFMLITMIVAVTKHLVEGDGFGKASHAIEDGIVFLSLIIIGAGKYSLDEKLKKFFMKKEMQ